MSQYHDIQTEIRDAAALVLALQRVTFKGQQPVKIENHKTAQHLFGFQNDQRKDKAHVIIRRNYVGQSSNDLGFLKQDNGKFRAIISEFDQGQGYNNQWMSRVNTYYGVECAKKEAESKGYQVSEDVDEKNRPRLRIKMGSGTFGGGGAYES